MVHVPLLYVVLCVGGNLLPLQVTSYTYNWFGVFELPYWLAAISSSEKYVFEVTFGTHFPILTVLPLSIFHFVSI